MGFQFIHLETYSRKADSKGRNTDFIFNEASRKPVASVHVPHPSPPTVVYGVGVEAVQEMHDAAASSATVEVKGGKSRKIRADQKTLHTVVASHPYTMDEVRSDPAKRREVEEWGQRTVQWLKGQYGDDLKSVIRHEDESHYHLHAYIVPVADPEMKAVKFHPGTTAKREIMGAGPAESEDTKAVSKRADAAYKAAMRKWQDSYHEAVAIPCGLTRLGPQRRRLSREEWQREQAQAKALQRTVEKAKAVKASGEQFIARTKAEAFTVTAAAAKEQEVAKRAIAAAKAAQDRAAKAKEEANAKLSEVRLYSGLGGRLRAVWDALGESKLATKIRQEFSAEIERVQAFARTIQDLLKAEEKRRHEAERKAYEAAQDAERARDAAVRLKIERDRAWAMLPQDRRQELAAAGPSTMTLQPTAKKDRK